MDIVKRLTLAAAKEPRSELAQLAFEATAHIESLRREIRTQRNEIALLHNERNVLLEWDRPQVDDFK
jgi:hypothetical protein